MFLHVSINFKKERIKYLGLKSYHICPPIRRHNSTATYVFQIF